MESESALLKESSCAVWGTDIDIVSGCVTFTLVCDGVDLLLPLFPALSDALIFQARDSKIGTVISTVSFPISRFMGSFLFVEVINQYTKCLIL